MTARIFALFIALLTLLNLLGKFMWPGYDGNGLWIYLSPLPVWLADAVLTIAALALLYFACRQSVCPRRSPLIAAVALTLAVFALANCLGFYSLLITGRIAAGFPVPFSLLIFCGLLLIARDAWWPRQKTIRHLRWRVAVGGAAVFVSFPLALMLFFGNTDYRRRADAVVVLGARAYADGRLSNALQDRIRTACELYRDGLTKKLVLSGGPGDGAIHETEAMRRYAIANGVRAEDIFIDRNGLNTEATVRNTTPLLQELGAKRVLAVSHFYHLPRIKLAYQRAGLEVYTVPARQGRWMRQIPYNMAREVAAFWVYYVKEKPLAQRPA
jgi:uncharacterized SAM-binding protein YcdF (DUF218 family)